MLSNTDQKVAIFWPSPGTRQDFHLLFDPAVEPLPIWFLGEGRVEGITRNGITHKLSLYVNDQTWLHPSQLL